MIKCLIEILHIVVKILLYFGSLCFCYFSFFPFVVVIFIILNQKEQNAVQIKARKIMNAYGKTIHLCAYTRLTILYVKYPFLPPISFLEPPMSSEKSKYSILLYITLLIKPRPDVDLVYKLGRWFNQ